MILGSLNSIFVGAVTLTQDSYLAKTSSCGFQSGTASEQQLGHRTTANSLCESMGEGKERVPPWLLIARGHRLGP